MKWETHLSWTAGPVGVMFNLALTVNTHGAKQAQTESLRNQDSLRDAPIATQSFLLWAKQPDWPNNESSGSEVRWRDVESSEDQTTLAPQPARFPGTHRCCLSSLSTSPPPGYCCYPQGIPSSSESTGLEQNAYLRPFPAIYYSVSLSSSLLSSVGCSAVVFTTHSTAVWAVSCSPKFLSQ